MSGPKRSLTLEATGQLADAAAYRPLIIAYRNGSPVRLQRRRRPSSTACENDKQASWFNGNRSILLAIQRQPDANTVAVVDEHPRAAARARGAAAGLRAAPRHARPLGLDPRLGRRRPVHAGLTVVLVVLVIFLFLRNVTATIIPALALPVSLIGTFAGMYLLGYSASTTCRCWR